jgi:hypothetical protein
LSRHFKQVAFLSPAAAAPRAPLRLLLCERLLEARPAAAIDALTTLITQLTSPAAAASSSSIGVTQVERLCADARLLGFVRERDGAAMQLQLAALLMHINTP